MKEGIQKMGKNILRGVFRLPSWKHLIYWLNEGKIFSHLIAEFNIIKHEMKNHWPYSEMIIRARL